MMLLDKIYAASPVWVQNLFATAYGFKEKRIRCSGKYLDFSEELKASEKWSIEKLRHLQNQRLRELVSFCCEQVPYYRELFQALGLKAEDVQTSEDLKKIPLLEKNTVRANPEKFVPENLSEKLIFQTTGGTTGTPLKYYVTPSAVQFNYAAYEVRFRNWAGVRFGQKFASINGKVIVPAGVKKPPFWRYNLAFNQVYLSAYHLQEENISSYVKCLDDFKPEFLVGYVSTVHPLAKFILQSGLKINFKLKAILVSSETLFDWMRADIEKAFNCKVFNGYGLGELSALITECEAGSMHVSPEYGIVELVPNGASHEIIATGLFNKAMPLLRYRTGDLAKPLETTMPCACGRNLPRIGPILGRVDDRIITPEGNTIGPAAMSLVFQSVPHLKEAQLEQKNPDEVDLRICWEPKASAKDKNYLMEELKKRLGLKIFIQVSEVAEIKRTAAGKQKLIISHIPLQKSGA